jgi:hypothetical protein
LTENEKRRFYDCLSPEKFDVTDLRRRFEEFNEEKNEESGEMMLAGITALRQALEVVDHQHVVLLDLSF